MRLLQNRKEEIRRGEKRLASYGTGALKVGSLVSRAFFLILSFGGAARIEDLSDVVVVATVLYTFLMLVGAGRIDAYECGVRVRDIFRERIYPWGSTSSFDSKMRVVVVDSRGRRASCWAVQRGNLGAAVGKESRVDRVVSELKEVHGKIDVEADPDVVPVVSAVRLTLWEWVQIMIILPASIVLGLLVSG